MHPPTHTAATEAGSDHAPQGHSQVQLLLQPQSALTAAMRVTMRKPEGEAEEKGKEERPTG